MAKKTEDSKTEIHWCKDGSIALWHSDNFASESFVKWTMDNLITMLQRMNKRKPKRSQKTSSEVKGK